MQSVIIEQVAYNEAAGRAQTGIQTVAVIIHICATVQLFLNGEALGTVLNGILSDLGR
jgi:hypothetical protein